MLVGIILACLGVGFTGFVFAWGYFAQRALTGPESLAAFFQTQAALSAAQNLALYLGFFLLFNGILRFLPKARVWSWLGPILILTGGVAFVLADVALFMLSPYIYPPAFNAPNFTSYVTLYSQIGSSAEFAGSIAVVLGALLSLVAVARGILARRAPPGPSALM